MNVILDSSVILALYDQKDTNHNKSVELIERILNENSDVWVTKHIFDEVVNILQKRGSRKSLENFIYRVETSKIRVYLPQNIYESTQILQKVTQLILKQLNTKVSFTDFHSIIIAKYYMQDCKVLSFDHHIINNTSL